MNRSTGSVTGPMMFETTLVEPHRFVHVSMHRKNLPRSARVKVMQGLVAPGMSTQVPTPGNVLGPGNVPGPG